VLARDGLRCVRCGSTKLEELHADHVHPWSKGGRTELGNLQTLCVRCNTRKGALARAELELVGQVAGLEVTARPDGPPFYPSIRILGVRQSFGRLDVLVTPLDGEGEAWVSADRVKVRGDKP